MRIELAMLGLMWSITITVIVWSWIVWYTKRGQKR